MRGVLYVKIYIAESPTKNNPNYGVTHFDILIYYSIMCEKIQ